MRNLSLWATREVPETIFKIKNNSHDNNKDDNFLKGKPSSVALSKVTMSNAGRQMSLLLRDKRGFLTASSSERFLSLQGGKSTKKLDVKTLHNILLFF